MACLDVSLMCSIAETFGMVTIESLSLGIPVIGTQSGGTPELLQNGKFGFLYPSGNTKYLSEKMKQIMLNNPFNQNDAIVYSKNFSKERVIPILEKVIFES